MIVGVNQPRMSKTLAMSDTRILFVTTSDDGGREIAM